ncbi:SDR family NAD(P)-dependent oxidoreductase [Streptomyces carpinensis]|nr:glucose 1-dehydrogenase [Streptomyces carpinensis]
MSSYSGLAGSSALVTGGASGLGRAIALRLGAAGARVLVVDRDAEGAEETAATVVADGGEAVGVPADIAVDDQVEAALAQAVGAWGGLDLAVNAAALMPDDRPLHQLDPAVFARILEVNVLGTALCLRHELAQMVRQGHGAVVNIGSVQSFLAGPAKPAYSASKHAVIALTESAANAYGELGIRVNAVCPGAMETPMVAARRAASGLDEAAYARGVAGVLPRLGDPGEVAEAVLWLLSDAASYVTGHALVADGGRLLRIGG